MTQNIADLKLRKFKITVDLHYVHVPWFTLVWDHTFLLVEIISKPKNIIFVVATSESGFIMFNNYNNMLGYITGITINSIIYRL